VASKNHEPLERGPQKPKRKWKWWQWALACLLLLALCDDDDKERKYCYTFGENDRLCFVEPLPEGQFCYLEADDQVRCYKQQN